MTKCPRCNKTNAIVNQCGCDPDNLPTEPPQESAVSDEKHWPEECHRYHAALFAAARTLQADNFENARAKAQLWNAAPKLLAALKGLMAPISPAEVAGANWCRVTSKVIKAARAAIAEAEGKKREPSTLPSAASRPLLGIDVYVAENWDGER